MKNLHTNEYYSEKYFNLKRKSKRREELYSCEIPATIKLREIISRASINEREREREREIYKAMSSTTATKENRIFQSSNANGYRTTILFVYNYDDSHDCITITSLLHHYYFGQHYYYEYNCNIYTLPSF